MPLPNAPSPLSYGAPQLSFDGLDQLGNNYFQGAEQRRKYDLARAFQNGIPRKADGTPDTQSMYEILAQHGSVDIPNLQDQADRNAVQRMVAPGGQSAAPQPAALAPQAATGAAVAPPQRAQATGTGDFRSATPAPNVSRETSPQNEGALAQKAAGGDDLWTLAVGLTQGANVPNLKDIVGRIATARGIDLGAQLTPEQERDVRLILDKAIKYKLAQGQGAAQPVAPQAPPAANEAVANLLPPGHPDPKEAVNYLRTAGDRLAGNPRGKDLAGQYYARANAIEATAFGAPTGFERGAGGVRPIAGGPEDPAYISAKADAGLKPIPLPPGSQLVNPKTGAPLFQNNSGLIDDDTAEAMAAQAEAGDTSVFTNLGRGAQGAENVLKVRQKIAEHNRLRGEGGTEQAMRNAEFGGIKAGQRTLGNRSANIELAATEFKQVLPVVRAASQAVSRTNYPDLNKIIQMWEEKTGDPNVVKFGGGVNTLVNLYARAISPSGTPTVSDKDHARLILNRAWSQGQFDAAADMMSQEIDAALSSPDKVRDAMRRRFLEGQGKGAPEATTARPAQTPSNDGWSVKRIE